MTPGCQLLTRGFSEVKQSVRGDMWVHFTLDEFYEQSAGLQDGDNPKLFCPSRQSFKVSICVKKKNDLKANWFLTKCKYLKITCTLSIRLSCFKHISMFDHLN